MTALADGFEAGVQDVEQELLARAVAQAATGVVGLQFVQVLVLGQELCKVLVGAEGIQVRKHGVALQVARRLDGQVLRVGEHGVHLLLQFLGRVARDRCSCPATSTSWPCRRCPAGACRPDFRAEESGAPPGCRHRYG